MKILYLALLHDLNEMIGVVNKINNQADSFKKNKAKINVFIFYKKGDCGILESKEYANINYIKLPAEKVPLILRNFWNYIYVLKKIRKINYDYIYMRYPYASLGLLLLVYIKRNLVVFEHNTIEYLDIKASQRYPKLRLLREKIFTKLIFRYIKGNIGMAEDFTEHQKNKVNFTISAITVTNGIDINRFPIKRKTKLNREIIIVFVGNVSYWHGLERVAKGLNYYQNPNYKIKLLLVGDKQKFRKIFKLVQNINVQIALLGYLKGKSLDEIYDTAHWAIGSLGLHRIGINSGAPLKHREYMARGIPFIFSGNDDDLHNKEFVENFLFNIDADESALDFNELIIKTKKIYFDTEDSKDIHSEIHRITSPIINMDNKIKKIINFVYHE